MQKLPPRDAVSPYARPSQAQFHLPVKISLSMSKKKANKKQVKKANTNNKKTNQAHEGTLLGFMLICRERGPAGFLPCRLARCVFFFSNVGGISSAGFFNGKDQHLEQVLPTPNLQAPCFFFFFSFFFCLFSFLFFFFFSSFFQV